MPTVGSTSPSVNTAARSATCTASINSGSTLTNRPAPAFTRCRSESGRKRLQARSIARSSRSTIARAVASASGSSTSRTTLVPSASQPALARVLEIVVVISRSRSPGDHRARFRGGRARFRGRRRGLGFGSVFAVSTGVVAVFRGRRRFRRRGLFGRRRLVWVGSVSVVCCRRRSTMRPAELRGRFEGFRGVRRGASPVSSCGAIAGSSGLTLAARAFRRGARGPAGEGLRGEQRESPGQRRGAGEQPAVAARQAAQRGVTGAARWRRCHGYIFDALAFDSLKTSLESSYPRSPAREAPHPTKTRLGAAAQLSGGESRGTRSPRVRTRESRARPGPARRRASRRATARARPSPAAGRRARRGPCRAP